MLTSVCCLVQGLQALVPTSLWDEMVRSRPERRKLELVLLMTNRGCCLRILKGLTEEQSIVRQRSEFEDADSLTGLLTIVRAVHPQ